MASAWASDGSASAGAASAATPVLLVAFGTRGDVQPLYLLARCILSRRPVIFVTHEAHRRVFNYGSMELCCVPTEPSKRCAAAEQEYELVIPLAARSSRVVFNLFSLGAWHLADKYRIPSVCLSPCVIPYEHPASFEARFVDAHPDLHAMLSTAPAGHICWADVLHWMWPLWLERWAQWRRHRLCLSEAPLTDATSLPRQTPLLYAISPHVLLRPPFWPDSVSLCGFLPEPKPRSRTRSDALIETHIGNTHGGALYVGFGSASDLLVGNGAATWIGRAAIHAAHALHRPLILHTCQSAELYSCWRAMVPVHAHERAPGQEAGEWSHEVVGEGACRGSTPVWLLHGELPLEAIMPRCALLVHHAGAGTCSCALRAAVPQLLCPVLFDQFGWAERLVHLGVGERLHLGLPAHAIDSSRQEEGQEEGHADVGGGKTAGGKTALGRTAADDADAFIRLEAELVSAFDRLTQPAVQGRCEEVAATLRRECGLATACELLGFAPELASEAKSEQWRGRGGAQLSDSPPRCSRALLDAAHAWQAKRQRAGEPPTESAIESIATRVRLSNNLNLSVWCTSPSEARHIFEEVWERRAYATEGLALDDGDVIIDTGANVGLFTLWAAREAPHARIISLEPAPETFRLLEANIADVGLGSRVRRRLLALGERSGTRVLSYYPQMPGNSTFHPAAKWEQRNAFSEERWAELYESREVECRVLPLSELLREEMPSRERVALLKVDVEGDELEVLRGVSSDADWGRIKSVAVETHSEELRCQVLELLREHYAEVHSVQDTHLRECGLQNSIVFARRPLPR